MQQSNSLQSCSDPRETWVLSDGHAGNHRQAQALAELLGRAFTPLVVPRSAFAPRRVFAPYYEGILGDVLSGRSAPPVLAIGCGRQAALATRLLRSRGACAIQILDPRIGTSHWDAVIVPRHDALRGSNVAVIDGSLHSVTGASLLAARHEFAHLGSLPSPRIAVLIGGDTHKRKMDHDVVIEALQAVSQQGSLMVTTSRRTPQALTQRIAQLPLPAKWSWGDEAPNPYMGYLAWADAIVCTADSVSMLTEAAATPSPLYLLGSLDSDAPSRFAQHLIQQGRAHAYEAGTLIDTTPMQALRGMDTLIEDLRRILASHR